MTFEVRPGNLDDPSVAALLERHHLTASAQTAAGSAHALDLESFRSADLSLWTLWSGGVLLACGALKALSAAEGEIKAMHTTQAARRKGAGRGMLAHLVGEARARGYRRVSLETGSWPYFEPARQLYLSQGFEPCAPFGTYREDPNSVFMTFDLTRPGPPTSPSGTAVR